VQAGVFRYRRAPMWHLHWQCISLSAECRDARGVSPALACAFFASGPLTYNQQASGVTAVVSNRQVAAMWQLPITANCEWMARFMPTHLDLANANLVNWQKTDTGYVLQANAAGMLESRYRSSTLQPSAALSSSFAALSTDATDRTIVTSLRVADPVCSAQTQ